MVESMDSLKERIRVLEEQNREKDRKIEELFLLFNSSDLLKEERFLKIRQENVPLFVRSDSLFE